MATVSYYNGMATARALANLIRFSLIDDGCWEWAGDFYPNGYGRCHTGGAGKAQGAHRVAFEVFNGPIPEGLVVNHLCENKGCVRPDHLVATTPRANTMYSDTPARRNLNKTHCARGHAFAETAFYSGTTSRRCRTCHRENTARARAKAKEG
jgi:hypothetical protein